MAVSMTSAGENMVTNAAAVAAACSPALTAAEVTAIGQFLQAAAKYPAARQPVGALIQNPNLLPQ